MANLPMMDWRQLLSADRPGRPPARNSEQARSEFERDYDRIVFSYPFRRLQDKTQVIPLPEHDFVHTRLTHSLEVSSVGRSLGKHVGERLLDKHTALKKEGYSAFDIGAIVSAAALCHDIGNPPFGHSGERAISDFFMHHPQAQAYKGLVTEKEWADLTSFEGNAQGFRLLNKRHYQGLQLTGATLAAFTKYPRESKVDQRDKSRRSQKKYGFFQSEKEAFASVATQVGLLRVAQGRHDQIWVRHPLAFLVEAADDICYHLIDLEDGTRLGLVPHEQTVELMALILGPKFDADKLNRIPYEDEQIGVLRAMAIGELIKQCSDLFMEKEEDILKGQWDASLVDEIPAKGILDQIIRVSIDKVYRSQAVLETEAAGFEVIGGLLEVFTEAVHAAAEDRATSRHNSIMRLLPTEIHEVTGRLETQAYDWLMAVVDHIAGMTDRYAMATFRKIKGIALPGR